MLLCAFSSNPRVNRDPQTVDFEVFQNKARFARPK